METITRNTLATILSSELKKKQGFNPRFSLRSFARKLKLNPGELSSLLKAKRPISNKRAKEILATCGTEL